MQVLAANEWTILNSDNLPPFGVQVLLRRKPTRFSEEIKYFVGTRVQLVARDQRPLGWLWYPRSITAKHISHFAYLNEIND